MTEEKLCCLLRASRPHLTLLAKGLEGLRQVVLLAELQDDLDDTAQGSSRGCLLTTLLLQACPLGKCAIQREIIPSKRASRRPQCCEQGQKQMPRTWDALRRLNFERHRCRAPSLEAGRTRRRLWGSRAFGGLSSLSFARLPARVRYRRALLLVSRTHAHSLARGCL